MSIIDTIESEKAKDQITEIVTLAGLFGYDVQYISDDDERIRIIMEKEHFYAMCIEKNGKIVWTVPPRNMFSFDVDNDFDYIKYSLLYR